MGFILARGSSFYYEEQGDGPPILLVPPGRGYMRLLTRSLAQAIPAATVREIDGAAHAVPFDAPGNVARVIAEATRASVLALDLAIDAEHDH
jgi:pimeloyl-ACP methyl ester carboxylesterase